MILLIDNYDSFTYNLYQLIGNFTKEITVIRNDKITIEKIENIKPTHIIISPGPGNPMNKNDFGICKDILLKFKHIPILGVCLGHQGIYYTYGGNIIKSLPVHGKKDKIKHKNSLLFKNIPQSFNIIRYHSLICDDTHIPYDIKITACNKEGIIMAIEHKQNPIYGIQFHPESIDSEYGEEIIKNFLDIQM